MDIQKLIGKKIDNKKFLGESSIFDGETSIIIGHCYQYGLEFVVLEDTSSKKIDYYLCTLELIEFLETGETPVRDFVW